MEVTIDGVAYAPADGGAGPRIGVGIKTRNRNEVVAKTLEHWRKHLPAGAVLVLVDDASRTPVAGADFRFEENAGIARASNKALELLYNADCEHIFLADDDAWPLTDGWWKPYVESPEPHLMAMWDMPDGSTRRQLETLYKDDQHVAYHQTRGYFLYVERRVLDRVGGMDPAFGKWGWEHASWSDRIHSAGLTTWRYADVTGSQDLIYSMDQHNEIASTATPEAMRYSQGPGAELRMASRHSDAYIEFRELDDVILTSLLTALPDPQRNSRMKPEHSMYKALHDSLKHDGRFVVLHTDLPEAGALAKAELVKVPQRINPYFERWLGYYRWLREHPEVGRVWCVDATDVQMTRNPFPEMEPGVLYAGWEPTTLRDEWMLAQHPDATVQKFMRDNPNLPLVNAGVVGGDRETMMRLAHSITKMYFDDWNDFIMGWETKRLGVGDMPTFNYVVRNGDFDLSSGPHVTNVFKSERASPVAWWKHK